MKKFFMVCLILLAIICLVYAAEKKVVVPPVPAGSVANQANAAPDAATMTPVEEITHLQELILAAKAAGLEPAPAWYARMIELSPAPRDVHRSLDQGGASWSTATRITSPMPYNDSGNLISANVGCIGQPYNDVFYELTVTVAGTYTFDMCGSLPPADMFMRIWMNPTSPCSGGTIYTNDDCCNLNPCLTIILTCGDSVFVELGTYNPAPSSAPYVFNVAGPTSPPCPPPCVPDGVVTLTPGPIPGPQTAHVCMHFDQYNPFSCMLVVPVSDASMVPIVTFTLGCDTCGDPNCWPLVAAPIVDPPGWIWNPAASSYFEFIHTTFDGCCACAHLDFIEPVELRAFEGLPGDNSVNLTWTTASESNTDHFEITRDGILAARVAATDVATGSTYHWTDVSAQNGTTYHYSLNGVDVDGSHQTLGTVAVTPNFDAAVIVEYALHQNYPNPFNPTTSIALDLVKSGFVSLNVYNLMGQEVTSLVNGSMTDGRHIVIFDASALSSGIYVCRLSVNGFVAEKKMLLMK
jgi:hypothetical protein